MKTKAIFLDVDGTLISFKTHKIPQTTETIFFCKITDYSEIFMTDLAGSDFSAVTEQAMGKWLI